MKSRSNRCAGCLLAGRGTGGPPGTPHCKSFRLCEVVDISMVVNFPGRTVADYVAMGREIAVAASLLGSELEAAIADVRDGEGLVALLLETHRRLFGNAFGESAGRFRLEGEEVHVGHEQHAFMGADGSAIEGLVRDLGNSHPLNGAPRDVHAFSYWAARFVRELFVIHPFTDGNGRTARAIVEASAWNAGLIVVWPTFRTTREARLDSTRYLEALQYAHANLGLTRAGHRPGFDGHRNPLKPLAAWWEQRLIDGRDIDDLDSTEFDPPDTEELHRLLEMLDRDEAADRRRARENDARVEWSRSPEVRSLVLPIVARTLRSSRRNR